MALRLERIQTEGIAQLSYLIGDDSEGIAAVIDPRMDVDVYLDLAQQQRLTITHIFETHIHADLMSGSRELQHHAPGSKIYVSASGGAQYGFEHEPVKPGDEFVFGKVRLQAVHTPGHTPEHVSYLALDDKHPHVPWGIFTGDSLFVSSAGRPDLLGSEQTDELSRQLFETLNDFYKKQPDGTIIYPGHGQGSPCGADIGDRLSSTIGYEKQANQFLQFTDFKPFKDYALSTAPPVPTYYPRMKKVNAEGPPVLGHLPHVQGLPPKSFRKMTEQGNAVVVDTRSMLAFGGGHVPQALNIGGRPEASIWAGWMLDPNRPILLVLEHDTELDQILRFFVRTGYTQFAGYLVGGMRSWDNAGLPIERVKQVSVHELHDNLGAYQIVDVRAPAEWKSGHIPRARHIFVPELPKRAGELDRTKPVATYCDSGYRASLAASLLQQQGFEKVFNVPGSWQAWAHANYPVEGAQREKS